MLRRVSEPSATPPGAPQRKPQPAPRSRIFLESRYRKLVRGLPQTIFWCPECKGDRRRRTGCTTCQGFGKLTRESVQELIGRRVLPAFGARTGAFHGAGREDVDVLMLGRGRPFVYEVIGARRTDVDLEALRSEILARAPGQIELAPFARVDKGRVAYWKQAQFDKMRPLGVPAARGLGEWNRTAGRIDDEGGALVAGQPAAALVPEFVV
jgi:tRNA pseudouridine(54/55) synthase